MELRCDSGPSSENKSDVLPQEEMDIMKTGCLVEGRGGDLVQRAFASLLDPTACWTGAGAEFQRKGSPGVAMAGKARVAGTASP